MLTNDFILTNTEAENRVTEEISGIPFNVVKKDGMAQPLGYVELPVGESCGAVFFLGMCTAKSGMSEWWGQAERFSNYTYRCFIGDKLGTVKVIYKDNTMEMLPVIFGVNAWNYELTTPLKPHEKGLSTFSGPYPEPFASDPAAAKLLSDSLVMTDTGLEKAMKFIFALKLESTKQVDKVGIYKDPHKDAGFTVSAITALRSGAALPEGLKYTTPKSMVRKDWLAGADKLARRIYQFRDELPAHVRPEPPEGYDGPKLKFEGTAGAEIFTNVYSHNLHDMKYCKVDDTGKPHTSSKWAPNFGLYVGLGTFRPENGSYYGHIWSRDTGRLLSELVEAGADKRAEMAADAMHKYLYDSSQRFPQPHWKRIANVSELGEDVAKTLDGKENDGHAAVMLFIAQLYNHGAVGIDWLRANRKAITDAAEWLQWQADHPEESNFDGVLYSESEASTQQRGGYDLFSNAMAVYGLRGYACIAVALEDKKLEEMCRSLADRIWAGIMDRFTTIHPRFGRIFVDTIDDCWTWEYKRLAPAFLAPDLTMYDIARHDPELWKLCTATYAAQKEDYFSFMSGRQMGYGQGYITESAIMLDEYADMAGCVEQAAMFCYHHTEYNYTVPEGVIIHPSGRYWYRNCDLGNAVQQAEIVKCARLLPGLDDNATWTGGGLRLVPRLPDGWTSIEASDYPVTGDARNRVNTSLKYTRTANGGFNLHFEASEKLTVEYVRFGPFAADVAGVKASSGQPVEMAEHSGRKFAYVKIDAKTDKLDITAEAF